MKAQDEERIRTQLEHIAQWRASGLPKAQWAAQQGIQLKNLVGWLTYERRCKARLSKQTIAPQVICSSLNLLVLMSIILLS